MSRYLHWIARLPLRRRLGGLFLFAVVLPVALVGWYGYDTTSRLLTEQALEFEDKRLTTVSGDLLDLLRQVPRDLGFLSEFHALQRFLVWRDLGDERQQREWMSNADQALVSFLESRGVYASLSVISLQGVPLVRVAYNRELYHAFSLSVDDQQRYRHAELLNKVEEMYRGQIFAFPPSLSRNWAGAEGERIPTMHFATPLLDSEGRARGLLTVELLADRVIQRVADEDRAMERDGHLYLVEAEHGHYLYHRDKAEEWGGEEGFENSLSVAQAGLFQRMGAAPVGAEVRDGLFSSYRRLEIPWLEEKDQWILLSQRDADRALAELSRFEVVFFAILAGSLLVVLLVSRRTINGILGPLQAATAMLRRLSRGRTVEERIPYLADDEVGEMLASARDLNDSLHQTIDQANAVAAGDFSQDVVLRSERDQLGLALQRMTDALRETTAIAGAVADGDYGRTMAVRGERDALGQSINRMTANLREVAAIAEAVAAGDFSRTMERAGDEDPLARSVNRMIERFRRVVRQANAISDGDYAVDVEAGSERDELGGALARMTDNLRAATATNARQDWLKNGQARLNDLVRGDQDVIALARKVIDFLVAYLEVQVGAVYLMGHDGKLHLSASHAYSSRKSLDNQFALGEGLVGQAALERQAIELSPVPAEYLTVQSGLGEAPPASVRVIPFLFEGEVRGVIELGGFRSFTETRREFLEVAAEVVAISINTADARVRMKELLEETQSQSEELQAQQEELRQANEELEERAEALELQREETRRKNEELERSRERLQAQTDELSQASRYKSEFLANMSHELRTPLNSLLILAQLLMENKDGNLTEKQQEFARTIHTAGSDLLELINEILDLSKVEAGKIELHPEELPLEELAATLQHKFLHVAESRGLEFQVELAGDLPDHIQSDRQRLEQVLKNLLSNAFKFTSEGSVRVRITPPAPGTRMMGGRNPAAMVAFQVIDSGIGIPAEKQKLIFEAFQQADGSTSRKYGGTGLGLSISRELAMLLGGELHLKSGEGKGSTFTLYLPLRLDGVAGQRPAGAAPAGRATAAPVAPSIPSRAQAAPAAVESPPAEPAPPSAVPSAAAVPSGPASRPFVADDRADLAPDERSLLIIEDDAAFAKVLLDLAREKGFLGIVSDNGENGLHLADYYRPSAIVLDIGLPGMDGWTVMQRLKDNPETRHIPVHFISGRDQGLDARRMGAVGFLIKPAGLGELSQAFSRLERFISHQPRSVLLVGGSAAHREQVVELLGQGDEVTVREAAGLEEARAAIADTPDCVVLDLDDGNAGVLELIEWMGGEGGYAQVPVILYASRDLSAEEEAVINRQAAHMIVKEVQSPERLLDEAVLFLHRVEAGLPAEQQQMIRQVHDKESILRGRKILIVDDDMRNVYALAATLEEKEVEVVVATNGRLGIEKLEENPETDLVLMDIMMPEMDGYQAMREIRKQERFRKLPIIALTAKAMKGDKAKCIEAGASDYLAKPVDVGKLLSMLRVWLYR
ncbi:response regulator [Endothiovibrio diazotrophicus]